jgi:hypothetical protein
MISCQQGCIQDLWYGILLHCKITFKCSLEPYTHAEDE